MAIIKFTYESLLQMRNEVNAACQASVSFRAFNAEKIKKFFRNGHMRLSLADDKLRSLHAQYCKLDENGNAIKLEEKEGRFKLEYIDENAEQEFKVKYKDFMSTTFDLEI